MTKEQEAKWREEYIRHEKANHLPRTGEVGAVAFQAFMAAKQSSQSEIDALTVTIEEQRRTIETLNSLVGCETTLDSITVVDKLMARIAELECVNKRVHGIHCTKRIYELEQIIADSQKQKPIARLLTWKAPNHIPAPHGGVCARTYVEYPIDTPVEQRYWFEGSPLYTSPIIRPAEKLTDRPDAQLCRFYNVTTYPELVESMLHHIERLQQARAPLSDTHPGIIREG